MAQLIGTRTDVGWLVAAVLVAALALVGMLEYLGITELLARLPF